MTLEVSVPRNLNFIDTGQAAGVAPSVVLQQDRMTVMRRYRHSF